MKRTQLLLVWSPRILGIAVGLFLAIFALDAFERGTPFRAAALDAALHLVPALVVLAIVGLSWRREWIGAAGFLLLAAAYAVMVRFRFDWTVAISGPLLIVGVLFFWSWWQRDVGVVR